MLATLARAKFGPLNSAETGLLAAAETGTEYKAPGPAPQLTEIRAPLLRWLCSDAAARAHLDPKGPRLHKVRIVGRLDLESVDSPIPLWLRESQLPDGVDLGYARFPYIDLLGSEVGHFAAVRLRCTASLMLSDGFVCNTGLRLRGAQIGGNLSLGAARLAATNDPALDLDNADIGNSLLVDRGFRADGQLRLINMRIGSHLNAESACLIAARHEPALLIEHSRIGGSLLLRRGFRALGQVRVLGGSIGNVEAIGSRLAARRDFALLIEGTNIPGVVLMRTDRYGPTAGRFRALGGVRLFGSTIAGNLDMSGAQLRATGRVALDATGLEAGGSANLSDGFRALGSIRFDRASIGGHLDFTGGQCLAAPDRDSVRIEGTRIAGSLLLRWGFRSLGRFYVYGGSVGNHVECDGARFSARRGQALQIEGVEVRGAVLLRRERWGPVPRAFRAIGGVRLFGSSIGAELDCDGALLLARGRAALAAAGVKIGGTLRMTGGLHARGRIDLSRAAIGGHLDLRGGTIGDADGAIRLGGARIAGTAFLGDGLRVLSELDLRDASIARIEDAPASWPAAGRLRLDGLNYLAIDPIDSDTRLQWLALQPPPAAGQRRFLAQPFEQLIQAMRRAGHERDARRVAIAKEDALRRSGPVLTLAGLRHTVYGATMRYGYRPQFALWFAPLFIFGLAAVLCLGAASVMVPAKDAAQKLWAEHKPLPAGYPSFSPLAYSIDTFVPILNLQQKDSWQVDDRARCEPGPERCGYWLRIYLWLHTAFGWIITTLAVAGFTGLVRKG